MSRCRLLRCIGSVIVCSDSQAVGPTYHRRYVAVPACCRSRTTRHQRMVASVARARAGARELAPRQESPARLRRPKAARSKWSAEALLRRRQRPGTGDSPRRNPPNGPTGATPGRAPRSDQPHHTPADGLADSRARETPTPPSAASPVRTSTQVRRRGHRGRGATRSTRSRADTGWEGVSVPVPA